MAKRSSKPRDTNRCRNKPHRQGSARWCMAMVVGLTVLAITACADDGPGRPASPQVTAQAPDDLFVSTARRSGALDAVSDSTILAAGREVCAALDRGVSPIEVLSLAIETGDTEGGVAIVGSAGSILCREHLPALEQLADRLNQ